MRPESDPENWFAANVEAPLVVARTLLGYRYTGFAALLMWLTATDAGHAACFFGIPIDSIEPFRSAFAVPPQFTPIGGCGSRIVRAAQTG